MIIKSVFLAWVLSQPVVQPSELDMLNQDCANMYNQYKELLKINTVTGSIFSQKLRHLCTPIVNQTSKE